jgi:hypothetical protein
MGFRCPSCGYSVIGDRDGAVKKQLRDHPEMVHKISGRDFEDLFSNLMTPTSVFGMTLVEW